MSLNLPEEFSKYNDYNKEQLMELATDAVPGGRKTVSHMLRSLGMHPAEYLKWPAEKRVEHLLANAVEEREEEEEPKKKASKPKAGASSTASSSSSNSNSSGGAVDAALKAKVNKLYETAVKIHDLLVAVITTSEKMTKTAEELGLDLELMGND